MDRISQYINKRTLIVGDIRSGKTERTFKILRMFLKAGYAKKIAILDLAPGSHGGIGMKMTPPENTDLIYLTSSIRAPRLSGKDENHAMKLAEDNAKTIEKLFIELQHERRDVLFINDVTLYFHAGHFKQILKILDTASTQIINAYYGKTFPDSELTRQEKRLTQALMKTCDRVITMTGRVPNTTNGKGSTSPT